MGDALAGGPSDAEVAGADVDRDKADECSSGEEGPDVGKVGLLAIEGIAGDMWAAGRTGVGVWRGFTVSESPVCPPVKGL